MRDHPAAGRDWTWWPSEWLGDSRLNTDKVEDWIITPRELHRRLASENPFLIVDVRERWEVDIVSLPGSTVMPLNELAYRALDELDPEDEIVLVCHHGIRSLEAARMLWDLGYENVKSLAGGLDRWVTEIDTSLSRY